MMSLLARVALLLGLIPLAIAHMELSHNATFDVQLLSGPKSQPSIAEMEVREARHAISFVRTALGVNGTLDLLGPQLDVADQFWKSLLANSSGNLATVELEIEARVSSELLNVTSFLAWYFTYAGQGYPSRLVDVNPQQYYQNDSEASDMVVVTQNYVVGWGRLPVTSYLPTEIAKLPFMPAFANYTEQSPMKLVLRDGTIFGYAITAVKDNDDGDGVHLSDRLYVPASLPEEYQEDIREHLAVQFSNSLKFAYEDIVSGKFVPADSGFHL